jgi:neurofibromin 1
LTYNCDISIFKDQLNEWANMTGFLCALGGVRLQNKPHRISATTIPAGLDTRKTSLMQTCGDSQYTITSWLTELQDNNKLTYWVTGQ